MSESNHVILDAGGLQPAKVSETNAPNPVSGPPGRTEVRPRDPSLRGADRSGRSSRSPAGPMIHEGNFVPSGTSPIPRDRFRWAEAPPKVFRCPAAAATPPPRTAEDSHPRTRESSATPSAPSPDTSAGLGSCGVPHRLPAGATVPFRARFGLSPSASGVRRFGNEEITQGPTRHNP